MKIVVVDRDRTKLDGLSVGLRNVEGIGFFHGEFGDVPLDVNVPNIAIVSPANSFGYMDGGIDLAYAKRWPTIQKEVQDHIKRRGTIWRTPGKKGHDSYNHGR